MKSSNTYSYRYYSYSGYRRERRPRRLNKRLLSTTLVVLAVAAPVVFFWHQYQLRRVCAGLLVQADRMESEELWGQAADALYRYWQILPDADVLSRVALTYDKAAIDSDRARVVHFYQRAIGLSPTRVDLRARLSELLAQDGQYALAIEQADEILAIEPENKTAWKWHSLASLGRYHQGQSVAIEDVLEEMSRAYDLQPEDAQLAASLAKIIRNDMKAVNGSELARQADHVIDRLVAATPNDPASHLLRYQYRTRYDLEGAERDLERALSMAPDNAAVVRQAAWKAHLDHDWFTARALFKDLVALEPSHPDGYVGMGDAEFYSNRPRLAIQIWEKGREASAVSLPLLLRLAEVQIQFRRFADAQRTFRDIDNWIASLTSRGGERGRNWANASVALLRGRWHLANRNSDQAISLLRTAAALGIESNAPQQLGGQPLAFSAYMRLGETFSELHQWEDAAPSFEQALELQADSSDAMLSAARAWAELGQLERAVRRASQAMKQPDAPMRTPLRLAQFLFDQQLRLPASHRDWTDFESALEKARQQLPDSWELQLLHVDYHLRRPGTDWDEAQSWALGILWSLERAHQHDPLVWRQLLSVYEWLDRREESDRALKRLDEITSSSPATRIELAFTLMGRDEREAARRVLGGLEPNQLTRSEQQELDFARLGLAELGGENIEPRLQELIDKYPDDTRAIELLLDRRFAKPELDDSATPSTSSLIAELKGRQGQTRSDWRYYAARHKLAVTIGAGEELTEVVVHLRNLENRRPYWSKTKELAGLVAFRQREVAKAIVAWEEAIKTANADPQVYYLLLREYLANSDYEAIWRMMDQWTEHPPLSQLRDQGARSLIQRRLDLMRSLIATVGSYGMTPDDLASMTTMLSEEPTRLFWLRMLMQRTGEHDIEAAKLLELLKQQRAEDIAAWMFQLKDDVDSGAQSQSDQTLTAIGHWPFASPQQKPYVWGQALQLKGLLAESREAYASVDKDAPFRVRAEVYGRVVANQLHRQQVEKTTAGGAAAMPAAVAKSRSDKRLRAVIRLRRAGTNDLVVAKQLLLGLVSQDPVDVNDRLLLATCYEALGQLDAAGEQLRLAATEDPSAQHMALYVDFLLRTDASDDASIWLEQLQQQAFTLRTVGLRARWLAAQHREEEIRPLVEAFAGRQLLRLSEQEIPALMRGIATIYRSVEMREDAERWLRLFIDRFPDHGEPLTMLLLESDVTERAIRKCIERLQHEPSPQTATLLARVMVYGDASEETQQQMIPILDESLLQFPDNGSLLFAIGNLRLKMGNTQEAIELLDRATKVQPGHYLAWNNLAALVAEEAGREEEAMEYIDQAIQVAGYQIPTLLDTKAVVLMHQERFEEAAELLAAVTKSRLANDPRFFFHQALALERLSQEEAARDSLFEATSLGLVKMFLTPRENEEFLRLQQRYAVSIDTGP